MDIDFLTDYYGNIIKPLEKVIKDEEQKYYSKPLIFRFVINIPCTGSVASYGV